MHSDHGVTTGPHAEACQARGRCCCIMKQPSALHVSMPIVLVVGRCARYGDLLAESGHFSTVNSY